MMLPVIAKSVTPHWAKTPYSSVVASRVLQNMVPKNTTNHTPAEGGADIMRQARDDGAHRADEQAHAGPPVRNATHQAGLPPGRCMAYGCETPKVPISREVPPLITR